MDSIKGCLVESFSSEYQAWYSEAKAVVSQLLPGRSDDFVKMYEIPKRRKDLSAHNYSVEDALQGVIVTNYHQEIIIGPEHALPKLKQ